MRRIVAHMEMSLDGVVDHPERWAHEYFAPDMLEAATSQMPETGTVLFGRRTYEEFAAVWPERPADDPFAGFLNSSLKVVVSRTLQEALTWKGTELLTGLDQVAKLKDQPGKDIAMSGSITLVGSLLREGLLDELSLLVSPVVLGKGKRLYEDAANPVGLQLIESRTLDNGVLALRYERAES